MQIETMSYHCIHARMVKIKKKNQVLTKMLSNWNSQTLLVGLVLPNIVGTATLENSLAISYKVKLTFTIRPRNPIPRYLLKRKKVYLLKPIYANVYSSLTYGSPKLETNTYPLSGEWINYGTSIQWNSTQ